VSINRNFIHRNAHALVTAALALALGLALVNVTAVRADSARKLYITEVNPPYDVVDELSCDDSFRVLVTADGKDMDVSQVEVTISGTNAKAAIKRKANKRTDIFRYPTFQSGYLTDPISAKELCGNGIDLAVFCVKLNDRRCEDVNASCCGTKCRNCMCDQCYARCEQAMRGFDGGARCLQDCASSQKC
jgi:hypothetical protein